MKKVLLDTSVIVDFLRRADKKNTLLFKLSAEDLYISIVTHTEIYCGKSVWEKARAQEEVEQLFSGINILPLVIEISQTAGKIKAKNQNRNILDCIIGATANHHNLELATLNRKDFERMEGVHISKD